MSARRRLPGAAAPGSNGQGLVEFALVLPIIALLVVAFVDMGRAVWAYTEITNAAREGARVAAVNQLTAVTECDETRPIEDAANAHWTIRGCVIATATPLGLTTSNITVAYSPPPSTTLTCSPTIHVGCIASVTVTYAYSPSTPIVSSFIHAVTFSSTSQMPVERIFP